MLEEKIERTEELIDDIVYELYELTDEEIEIVEEAVGSNIRRAAGGGTGGSAAGWANGERSEP